MAVSQLEIPIPSQANGQAVGRKVTAELTRRASLNAAASLAVYFTQVVVGLVVSPILVGGLGVSLFGVWQILGRLVTYMSAADGRPTEALRLVIAHQQGSENNDIKRRFIGSALGLWLLSLPVLVAAGAILIWLSPFIAKMPHESYPMIRLACALLVINFLLANLAALPESVLRGMNLGYRRLGLQAGVIAAGGFLMVGAIYLGFGLVGVAAAQVILSGLTGILFWAVVKRFVPWFGVALPTWAEVRSILGVSLWSFLGSLIAKIHLGSDLIVLGVIASASTVTTYVLTGYVAMAAMPIISLIFIAVGPGLGGIIGQKQYAKAARVLEEMLAMNWLLAAAVGSTILLCNRSFLHLWVGSEHYAGFWTDLLIVLIMIQTVYIRTHSCVIDAALQVRQRVIVNAVAALLSVVFMVILTPYLGIVGLCLGLLGGRVVQSIYLPIIVRSCLDRRPASAWADIARRGLVLGLLLASSAYLGQRYLAGNWMELTACVGGSLGLILALAFVAGLSSDSRAQLISRFRWMVPLRG